MAPTAIVNGKPTADALESRLYDLIREAYNEKSPDQNENIDAGHTQLLPSTEHFKLKDEKRQRTFNATKSTIEGLAHLVKPSVVFKWWFALMAANISIVGFSTISLTALLDLDDSLIEAGQNAWRQKDDGWDVQEMLNTVKETYRVDAERKESREGIEKHISSPATSDPIESSLRKVLMDLLLSCHLREVLAARCIVFLQEYQDAIRREDIRAGLEDKLPIELIDIVAEWAAEGRNIPKIPGMHLTVPNESGNASPEERHRKVAKMAVKCWKQLQSNKD
ncbi:hypothetical protein NA57DRAFT_81090 [Rhizodiscina lignyota]|uniref:Uncharacterized protein n=1 Tax=Rhizodiscina lignyota TaxID=1504668 RepID=A0A9P4I4Z7_9PEZI|nr:hypothetical protein NA57DRAFT_81090 [Rhizodiscina lignyota]